MENQWILDGRTFKYIKVKTFDFWPIFVFSRFDRNCLVSTQCRADISRSKYHTRREASGVMCKI